MQTSRGSRRVFCRLLATAALSARAAASGTPSPIGFGSRLYGLKSLKTADALRLLAKIGYDDVEIELRPGWGTEPKSLDPPARRELRRLLEELRLRLPAVNESLTLAVDESAHHSNLERLKLAADLHHDLAPGNPPLLETVLGGKTQDWERVKSRMAERLRDWAAVAKDSRLTIAVKAHVGSAMDRPERCLWLLRQVDSPWIKIGYDYSHFHLIGLTLKDSLDQLLPSTAIIHVKDSRGAPEKHEFLLPGDGDTDYVAYFKMLKQAEYRGSVVVEVSAMIHGKPGYDPIATAKHCYANLAPAFGKAGVERPHRRL